MRFFLLSLSFFLIPALWAQDSYRVAFYNVENYFDCEDDSLTNDDEFLPYQGKYWTYSRLKTKRTNIARVIAAIGEGKPPLLVGMVEVENDQVLKELVRYSPLRKWRYSYAHFESPDPRGIDVALLYQPSQFHLLHAQVYPVCFEKGHCSRDILYVRGQIQPSHEILHVLVCHTPSKRGGAAQSAYKRCKATSLVRALVDSISAENQQAKVLVMGDFNDTPTDESIVNCLGAKRWTGVSEQVGISNPAGTFYLEEDFNQSTEAGNLYQLMPQRGGTYKYKGEWSILDQMFASSSLLLNQGLHIKDNQAHIFSAKFLLQEDKTHLGVKPFRTYLGPRYLGGFSDHLPIYLDLLEE